MILISHTQAATIPRPIKETTCPLFPPEDRIPKLGASIQIPFLPFYPISLFLGLWFLLTKHPLIISFKEIPKGASSPSSVFSLLLEKPSFAHPVSSSSLISSVNLRQRRSISNVSNPLSSPPLLSSHQGFFFADVYLRSRRHLLVRRNHLYRSIAVSPPLCDVCLACPMGRRKHTNLIITDLRNGERARQLVFHRKLMQHRPVL